MRTYIALLLFYFSLFCFILFHRYTQVVNVKWKNHFKEPLPSLWSLCHESVTSLYLYPVRQHSIEHAGTSTGKPRSFDCLTAPASRTHLAAAIARNISHCSHIESPVQYRVTCYRRSRREMRCIQHASTRGNAFRPWKAAYFTFTFFTRTYLFIHASLV